MQLGTALELVMNLIIALQAQAVANFSIQYTCDPFIAVLLSVFFTQHCLIIVVTSALTTIIKCCFLGVFTSSLLSIAS